MKVLVTGVTGQLGYDIVKVLSKRHIDHVGVSRADFDITDEMAVKESILSYCPDIVIHCSAYTAVDKAEEEPLLCEMVNEKGTYFIAEACKEIDAKMMYISTDYVFPGIGEAEYEIYDLTGPLNVYGRTKLAGEQAVKELLYKYFIVRVSWVFGINGNNFVKTMLRIGKERKEVNVVYDQIGSPTYTVDLAELLCDMIITDKYGIYHATNEGYCSWAEFAEEIFMLAGYSTRVNRIASSEYKMRAVRPLNSRLSKKSLDKEGFKRLPDWKDALRRFINDLDNE